MPKTQPKPPRRSNKQEPHAGGRRTKLTPDVHERIVAMIQGGMTYKRAAQANGIGESTLHAWRQRGEYAYDESERRKTATMEALRAECKLRGLPPTGKKKQTLIDRLNEDEAPYVEFVEALKKADAEREFLILGQIAKAADDDWRAGAWLLERTEPGRYARRTVNEQILTGKDGGPIELHELTEDAREEMEKALERVSDNMAKAKLEAVPDKPPDPPQEATG